MKSESRRKFKFARDVSRVTCHRVNRGVARIFGLGADHVMSCGARPCEHRNCEAHAKPFLCTKFTAAFSVSLSGSSPRRILLIRMPKMHFPSIWHHQHNLSNHEVQQLTFNTSFIPHTVKVTNIFTIIPFNSLTNGKTIVKYLVPSLHLMIGSKYQGSRVRQ